jgi:plastocyanin
MKVYRWISSLQCLVFLASAGWFVTRPPAALGSTTVSVSVFDNFFSPRNVTNTIGDSVQWSWEGNNSHSSTGSGVVPLWDSGIHGNGFVFTEKFPVAGTFPYRCVVHSGQTGSILVNALPTNAPPTISILSPTNGAIFSAPWTGTILATASDSDGTVSRVDFRAGSTLLGTRSNPQPELSWTVTNMAAGSYNLTAIATDNQGGVTTSAPVAISVLAPAPITLSLPRWLTATGFQFSYTATAGLAYVVQRSENLSNWTPIATNRADSSTVTFLDRAATAPATFYSITLAPNP